MRGFNEFEIEGIRMGFHPEGAVWLPSSRSLVVSDIHLGKGLAFQARGMPVPEGSSQRDLERLRALARSVSAGELVVAGDLFHSADGMTADTGRWLQEFLCALAIPVSLVMGNHDRKVGRIPEGMDLVPVLHRGGVEICHDPEEVSGDSSLGLAGHLHPVVRIPDGRRTSLRLPCFWLRSGVLVLPSFGSFTGGQVVCPSRGDKVFASVGEEVREIPESLWLRR